MLNTILIIGIISSLLYYELTEISPGGIIAPVYFAIYIDNPQKILVSLLLAVATYIMVELFSNIMILYGRRKFAVYIITSLMLKYIFERIGVNIAENIAENYEIILSTSAIGVIIPAIIARDIEKQGYLKTLASVMVVSIFIKASVELINEVIKL